jgi:hypothetical protein
MEKNATTKSLPKGYCEISSFIELLNKEAFLKNLREQEIEDRIALFLEHIYTKRLSVGQTLLQIMLECREDDVKASLVAWILSRCSPGKTLNHILDIFESPDTPDKIRYKLILVLEKYGEIERISQLIPYFQDKERLDKYLIQSLLDCIGPSGEEKQNLFQHLANQEVEFYRALASRLHYNGDQSIWLLAALAEFPDDKVADASIMALSESNSPLAYDLLQTVLVNTKAKEGMRRKALEKLEIAGISKNTQRLCVPHKCYLSWIDGNGGRILLMSQRSGGRNKLGMITFMLNEEEGIQDSSSWTEISSFEMESVIKSLEKEVGLRQIDYEKGIRVLENALWVILQAKKIIPPSFLSAKRILGFPKLTPRPYIIDPQRLGWEPLGDKMELLVQSSDGLLDHLPFSEWAAEASDCQDAMKGKLPGEGKIRKTAVTQFIKTVLEPTRASWKRRLLLTADFFYGISPRSYRSQIETCLAIALAIENGKHLNAIPFFVAMATLSLERIRESSSEHVDKSE